MQENYVGFYFLTKLLMRSCTFWEVTHCIPVKVRPDYTVLYPRDGTVHIHRREKLGFYVALLLVTVRTL